MNMSLKYVARHVHHKIIPLQTVSVSNEIQNTRNFKCQHYIKYSVIFTATVLQFVFVSLFVLRPTIRLIAVYSRTDMSWMH